MRFRALSAGIEVPTASFSGTIQTVFRHACNIRLEDETLLTLLSSKSGNVPYGIRVDTPPGFSFVTRVRVGQPVACRGGIFRVGGTDLSVDLRDMSRWQINLKGLRVDFHQLDVAQAWTAAWLEWERYRREDGLSALIEPLQPEHRNPVASTAVQVLLQRRAQSLPALITATQNLQGDEALAATEPLIGLGPGLTPSGDDFLVGYLAGLWSTAGNDPARLSFLRSIGTWLSEMAVGTNAISRAYIRSATRGNVSEAIATLAQGIERGRDINGVRATTRTALRVGHTSGADGVLGLLLGLLTWAACSSSFHARPFSLLSISCSTLRYRRETMSLNGVAQPCAANP